MGILDMFTQVVWLAAGLAILGAVVSFFLVGIYDEYRDVKAEHDREEAAYLLGVKVLAEYEASGLSVTVEFKEDDDDSHTTNKARD